MTLMRLREITPCCVHRRTIVVLEDAQRQFTLTFYADPQEASRLVRLLERGPEACHPVFDFVRGRILGAGAAPRAITLEHRLPPDDPMAEPLGLRELESAAGEHVVNFPAAQADQMIVSMLGVRIVAGRAAGDFHRLELA